jgi:anti-sigma regulatory factor (Ser/Thr protein kinase)
MMDVAALQADGGAHYRHEAFLYANPDEFFDISVRFILDAIAANEPILVILAAEKISQIRSRLNGRSRAVLFAEMSDIGDNPAHIIPAWDDFLKGNAAPGTSFRGIGEPIVAGQSPAKLAECQRHEALLNIAFANPEFWLLCPYDASVMSSEVIDEARRTHPFLIENGFSRSSSTFAGPEVLSEPYRAPLPDPPEGVVSLWFQVGDLGDVREHVTSRAVRAGMKRDRIDDLVLATNEIATNSLRYGGGRGSLRAWDEAGWVICEISDDGIIEDPLLGRLRPSIHKSGGRGLWLANQLCDLVQTRALPPGTVTRLHVRRS